MSMIKLDNGICLEDGGKFGKIFDINEVKYIEYYIPPEINVKETFSLTVDVFFKDGTMITQKNLSKEYLDDFIDRLGCK